MQRFFVENIGGDTVKISGSEAHHIKNVLRKKKGDAVFLFDGKGVEYKAEIERIGELEIRLKVVSKEQKDIEPKIKINLYQSIPKLKKFDFIVEKSTELGVSKIVPVISQRTQVSQIKDTNYTDRKIKRWQKIALSASKQCGRMVVPEISPITTLQDATMSLRGGAEAISLIPWECEQKTTLKHTLKSFNLSIFQSFNLFIGPEGGFSNSEIELAKKCGVIPVTLGRRVLRAETAPIVVISNILYELEC
ncbi:MAG: 16S rRNA (uracil(1498)-N(3))-methyltransferase [Elusimicrobia bacterium]|nr:16S rRNA (uracil(1498)-N(3))-methyltransferase [Elusimicrobiota bacterium]